MQLQCPYVILQLLDAALLFLYLRLLRVNKRVRFLQLGVCFLQKSLLGAQRLAHVVEASGQRVVGALLAYPVGKQLIERVDLVLFFFNCGLLLFQLLLELQLLLRNELVVLLF